MYNISLLNKTESAVLRLTHRMYRPIYVSNNTYPRQYEVYIYIIYRVEMCSITRITGTSLNMSFSHNFSTLRKISSRIATSQKLIKKYNKKMNWSQNFLIHSTKKLFSIENRRIIIYCGCCIIITATDTNDDADFRIDIADMTNMIAFIALEHSNSFEYFY